MLGFSNRPPAADTSYRFHYRVPLASSRSLTRRRVEWQESGDLISFLAIAHRHALDLIAISWQLPLGAIGNGATAEIHQSALNLKTSLAFKRPAVSRSPSELCQEYRVLISEIMVLGHAATRYHPNIVTLEGICWDFQPDTGEAWPVLIFEKAQERDLGKFLNSEAGRRLDIKERLQLCQDVAVALTCLHGYAIIHGDINPQNILVFKEGENYYAKLSDFGYSALMSKGANIDMATTWPWNAPECGETWLFDFLAAQKTDIYSFGTVCLWILFNEDFREDTPKFKISNQYNYNWLEQLRKQGTTKAFALSRVERLTNLDEAQRRGLQRFFELSLAEDPETRVLFLRGLFYQKNDCAEANFDAVETKFHAPPEEPYAALFQLSKVWYQTMLGDFRLRQSIFKALEFQAASHPDERCQRNSAFQLAFCYEIGFGCDRCTSESLRWLDNSGKTTGDLDQEIRVIQADEGPWHLGLARELGRPGIADGYGENNILEEAERIYRRTISGLECILNKSHSIVIEQKVTLAEILNSQGRFQESEGLLLELANTCRETLEESHPSTLTVMRALRETYYYLGRWNEMVRLISDERAIWKQMKPFSNLLSYSQNALNEESTLGGLAVGYFRQGKYEEAEEMVLKRMKLAKEMYGEEHERTMLCMADLAVVYMHFGIIAESRRLIHQAIAVGEKILAKDDPNLLHVTTLLTGAYATRRERKEAGNMGIRTLETCRRVLGDEHKTTLLGISLLSRNYYYQGRLREGVELQEECARVRQATLGQSHPDTAVAVANLALFYWRQVRWEEAEAMQTRAVDMYVKSLGETHVDTISQTAWLAYMKRKQRFWGAVAKIIPKTVIMTAAWLAESAYAWLERTLHSYA